MGELAQEPETENMSADSARALAEVAAAFAKANRLLSNLLRHARPLGPIPLHGQVKIIAPPEEFADISGEEGIILGGGPVENIGYTYTVWVLPKGETYYLQGSALLFTGTVVRASDIYSGDSLKIQVDAKTGEGRIVRTSKRKGSAT